MLLLNKILKSNRFKNNLIKKFRKCELCLFNANNVDYTKCISTDDNERYSSNTLTDWIWFWMYFKGNRSSEFLHLWQMNSTNRNLMKNGQAMWNWLIYSNFTKMYSLITNFKTFLTSDYPANAFDLDFPLPNFS